MNTDAMNTVLVLLRSRLQLRTGSDAGTALIEFVWLAIVLLLPMVYIMIAVFDVQRASYGVSAAGQAAAQSFVSAPDVPAAYARAHKTAELTLQDHELSKATVTIDCVPSAQSCLEPGSSVQVTVIVEQPLPLSPEIFGDQLADVTVERSHTEPYGQFREAKPQ